MHSIFSENCVCTQGFRDFFANLHAMLTDVPFFPSDLTKIVSVLSIPSLSERPAMISALSRNALKLSQP